MTYKLFIDDERDPILTDWVIARTSANAIVIVKSKGIPVEIAFDHDLGGEDTSVEFLHWLAYFMLDNKVKLPKSFKYSVHSQNPIGVKNIHSFMVDIQRISNGN